MSHNNKHKFLKGRYYHLYNRVITGSNLFNDEKEYLIFFKRYDKYFRNYFTTYAYCLIPNHFHFLVKVKDNVDEFVKLEKTNASKKYINNDEPYNFFLEHQLSRMFSGGYFSI